MCQAAALLPDEDIDKDSNFGGSLRWDSTFLNDVALSNVVSTLSFLWFFPVSIGLDLVRFVLAYNTVLVSWVKFGLWVQ